MISTDIQNAIGVMLGSQEAEALYIGSNLIWQQSSPLPYDAEIEYIESTGTQYINTLYHINPNTSFDWDVCFCMNNKTDNSSALNNGFIGVDATESYYTFSWNFGSTREQYNTIYYWCRSKYGVSMGPKGTEPGTTVIQRTFNYSNLFENNFENRTTIHYENQQVTMFESNIQTLECIHTFNSNLLIHGNASGAFDRMNLRTHSLKLYDNNVLIRDFIPVRVGQIGYMYDKVSGQLFGNQGTGDFILGSDKT